MAEIQKNKQEHTGLLRPRLRIDPFLLLLYFIGPNKTQVNAHSRDERADSPLMEELQSDNANGMSTDGSEE